MTPTQPKTPRNEGYSAAIKERFTDIEKDVKDVKEDLEECKDLKGQMQVLDERTTVLLKKAERNENAIYGTNGSPGMQTRITSVENSIEEVKGDVSAFKKVGYGVLVAAIGIFLELLAQLILSHGTALAK